MFTCHSYLSKAGKNVFCAPLPGTDPLARGPGPWHLTQSCTCGSAMSSAVPALPGGHNSMWPPPIFQLLFIVPGESLRKSEMTGVCATGSMKWSPSCNFCSTGCLTHPATASVSVWLEIPRLNTEYKASVLYHVKSVVVFSEPCWKQSFVTQTPVLNVCERGTLARRVSGCLVGNVSQRSWFTVAEGNIVFWETGTMPRRRGTANSVLWIPRCDGGIRTENRSSVPRESSSSERFHCDAGMFCPWKVSWIPSTRTRWAIR